MGDGIYFWEHNARRALDFAKTMAARPHPSGQKIKKPAVIGAVINLGYCLNLLDSRYIQLVRDAHALLVDATTKSEAPLPESSGGPDLVDRKLDCAVVRALHKKREDVKSQPFESVRAAFVEGEVLYRNAGFASQSHIQVCIRDPRHIIGYFRPLSDEGKLVSLR